MTTDFERRLSELLHTTTPEPPVTYRFAPPADPAPRSGDEVDLVRETDLRKPRWMPLLAAAAAVVVLASGVTAALLRHDNHGSPVTTAPPSVSEAPSAAPCTNDNLLLRQRSTRRSGARLTTVVTVANTGATTCTLTPVPVLSLQRGATGTATPTGSDEVVLSADLSMRNRRLTAGTALAYTVRLDVAPSCPESARGPSSVVIDDEGGFEYGFPLAAVDCPTVPVSVTADLVPSR